MDGKKWLIVLLLLIGFKGFGQSFQYTYVDPCTGVPNTVTISQPSGSVTLFYAGQYQNFTATQLQTGGYEAWVASINATYPPGSNPCAGNAGVVSGTASASVGTNVTNTVTNITGALSTLGSSTSGGSVGGMSTSTSSSGSSSSSSSSSSDDSGSSGSSDDNTGTSSGDGGSTSSGSSSSGSSGDGGSGSTGGSSGSGDTGGSGGGNTGGDTGGGSSGGGDTGGGGSSGGGDTGGGSGGSSGGGDTGGGSSSGGSTEGSVSSDGGGATSDGDGGSSNGGAIGDKDIDAESGGQSSDSDSDDSGGGGGKKKKKGSRARKGSLIASGDMVVVRNGSDYKQGGNDNLKFNMGVTWANTEQTITAGGLLNYTTGQNEISLTGYGSFKIEESMIVASNSFLYNVSQETWFNTGNAMYAFKQNKYLTTLIGTNFSYGQLGEESFSNWAANVGTFTTFNGYRGFAMNLMGIAMYSPYTFFYEGQWFKGGFLFVPLTSFDFNVTKTFKFNVSTSTVYLMGEGILNFQLMTGTKMLL
jgi:hypothetical protein